MAHNHEVAGSIPAVATNVSAIALRAGLGRHFEQMASDRAAVAGIMRREGVPVSTAFARHSLRSLMAVVSVANAR